MLDMPPELERVFAGLAAYLFRKRHTVQDLALIGVTDVGTSTGQHAGTGGIDRHGHFADAELDRKKLSRDRVTDQTGWTPAGNR